MLSHCFADSSQRGATNIGFLGMTPTLSSSHTSSLGLGSLFRADTQTGCPLSSRSTRLPLDFRRNQASGSPARQLICILAFFECRRFQRVQKSHMLRHLLYHASLFTELPETLAWWSRSWLAASSCGCPRVSRGSFWCYRVGVYLRTKRQRVDEMAPR